MKKEAIVVTLELVIIIAIITYFVWLGTRGHSKIWDIKTNNKPFHQAVY